MPPPTRVGDGISVASRQLDVITRMREVVMSTELRSLSTRPRARNRSRVGARRALRSPMWRLRQYCGSIATDDVLRCADCVSGRRLSRSAPPARGDAQAATARTAIRPAAPPPSRAGFSLWASDAHRPRPQRPRLPCQQRRLLRSPELTLPLSWLVGSYLSRRRNQRSVGARIPLRDEALRAPTS